MRSYVDWGIAAQKCQSSKVCRKVSNINSTRVIQLWLFL